MPLLNVAILQKKDRAEIMTATVATPNGESRLGDITPRASSAPQTDLMVPVKKEPGAILTLAQQAGNPIEFLSKAGEMVAKSGMLGIAKPERGATLLLICMTEGKTPLQVISEFHIMDDGKLAKKAEWVLSRFRQIGGKFFIIDDGSDGKKATYRFVYLDNDITFMYTIDDANKEGLVKTGSRWVKNPASMLRARVITGGVGMVAPEVKAGFNTEEELDGQTDGPAPAAATTGAGRGRKPAAAATTAGNASPAVAPQTAASPAEDVIDAEVVSASEQTEQVPFDGGTQAASAQPAAGDTAATQAKFSGPGSSPASTAVLNQQQPAAAAAEASPTATPETSDVNATILDIEFHLGKLGIARADYEAQSYARYQDYKTLDEMPLERLQDVLNKVRNAVAKKQQTQAPQ